MGLTGNEDLGTFVDVYPAPLILVLISKGRKLVCYQDYKGSSRSARFMNAVDESSIISLLGQHGPNEEEFGEKGELLRRAPRRLPGGCQFVLVAVEASLRSRSGRRMQGERRSR